MSHDCHITRAGDGPVSHDTGDVGGEGHQLVCTAPRNAQVDGPSPLLKERRARVYKECKTCTWAPPSLLRERSVKHVHGPLPLLRERRARIYRNYFATCIHVLVCC